MQAEDVELAQKLLSAMLWESTKLEEIYESVKSPVENYITEQRNREKLRVSLLLLKLWQPILSPSTRLWIASTSLTQSSRHSLLSKKIADPNLRVPSAGGSLLHRAKGKGLVPLSTPIFAA